MLLYAHIYFIKKLVYEIHSVVKILSYRTIATSGNVISKQYIFK